ncbi:HET-domain-containing protein, partial [Colletotrichum sublineola]
VLPTRVIDLGPAGSDETPRLYISRPGEKAAYVALNHCCGGAIPASIVQGNLEARLEALCVDELPRNFQDAIAVTQVLGFRYLWIDSLCIVQDLPTDWAAEAGRMAQLYTGATLVLSALEAPSSDVGFLHLETERVPRAEVNEEYAVQKLFTRVYEYLDECPLNKRAWCMQERLLAPRVLHFGRQQMFWECDSCFTTE